jgi:hypothetical protein
VGNWFEGGEGLVEEVDQVEGAVGGTPVVDGGVEAVEGGGGAYGCGQACRVRCIGALGEDLAQGSAPSLQFFQSPGAQGRRVPNEAAERERFVGVLAGWSNRQSTCVSALGSLVPVSGKSKRRAARSVVAEYHETELGELVARVGETIDRYRAGELDAFEVDRVLFQYSRAAKELWKYCNYLHPEIAAIMIRELPPHDWWERGAPRERS